MSKNKDKARGEILRDEGISAAVGKAESEIVNWAARAEQMIYRFAKLFPGRAFIVEELRLWAHQHGLPAPSNPKAWGGPVQKAARDSVIVKTGSYKVSDSKARHATPNIEWRVAA